MAKKVKLENYIHIQNGYAFKSNLFQNFGVPVVRITNVENGKLNLDKVVYYSEDKKLDKFFIKNNDILLSLTGDDKTLKVCINESDEKLYLNQRVAILRSNESLVQKYLYYSIKKYSLLILEKAKGIAQKNISVDDINSLEIPLPDLDEQKQIAKTLDKAQELIDLRKESIAKLDELAKSIFIDMFGDPVSNPKGWTIEKFVKYIDYIGDIGSNGSNAVISKNLKMSDKKDFALMVRTVNLNKNDFNNDVKYVSEETYNFFKKSKIYGGEIIMNKIGSAGKFWIMPKLNIPVSLGLNQLMIKLKDLNTKFLYYFLSTEYGQVMIASKTNGAVTKSITKGAVKDFDIAVPPKDLQNKFASIIEKIEEHKSLYEQELEKLEENFQALLQQSFKE